MTVVGAQQAMVTSDAPRRNHSREVRREALFGFGMIGLSMLFVAVFTAGPIIVSFILSFFSWDVISDPIFIGMDNYTRIFKNGTVLHSLGVTLVIGISIVILQLLLGLGLAVLVNQRRRNSARTFFRTGFYLPLLASTAAVSIFMGYLFDAKFGVINYYLGLLHIPNVPWLTSPVGAVATIVLVSVWQQTGFTFVLFVAALMSVPTDILEAAQVDGAGPLRMLLRIKIPLISPTILFAAVVALINAMQLFDQPYIMTTGGPGDATTTMAIVMYRAAFQNLEFGFGSAIAILLLLVILAITGLQFLAARKLVFFQ